MLKKIKSLKVAASVEKLDGGGIGFMVLFLKVKDWHPYRKMNVNHHSFVMTLRFLLWDFNIMVYKPAKNALNRAERRAKHMK